MAARGLHPRNCVIRGGEQRTESLEQIWHRFFDDPSLWWDNRAKNWPSPDFRNISTGEGLWIASCPEWVRLKVQKSEKGVRAQYKEGKSETNEQIQRGTDKVGVLLSALKKCRGPTDFQKVKMVHQAAMESGHISDIYVANSLVNSYAKCGGMPEARKIFDGMCRRDSVTWNALMFGYVVNGEAEAALELFVRMEQKPDARSFIAAVKACTSLALKEEPREVDGKLVKVESLNKGMSIHSQALDNGHGGYLFLANSLVDMYAKCGRMDKALEVFTKMESRDTVSWNALMFGYVENGYGELALKLLMRMKTEGCAPDDLSFIAALKACSSLAMKDKQASLEKGVFIHNQAVNSGYVSIIRVRNTLIDMYAKCGNALEARKVFNEIRNPDTVSWNAMILGYADNGLGDLAIELFKRMRRNGCTPDAITFKAVLKACSTVVAFQTGRDIHAAICDQGLENVKELANCLVDFYGKCGRMDNALEVFTKMESRDTVSWNALMFGYVENGYGELALKLLMRMKTEGCAPNDLSFIAALKACTSLAMKEDGISIAGKIVKQASLEKGVAIHNQAVNSGYGSIIRVRSTLIDMYAKCGKTLEARKVFDEIRDPDTVSWNAMILGYADNGSGDLALELYNRMRREGCTPSTVTFIAVLKACSKVVAFQTGRDIHAAICDQGLENDNEIATCLVDFYGKCGRMAEAQNVFDSFVKKDLVTWTALMAGYSWHGDTGRVFQLFEQMRSKGVKPDGVTFLCMLTACCHAGLVEQGKVYFEAMRSEFQVKQEREHYHCMIDILGRANELKQALSMVEQMPYVANSVTWTTILGACRKWKNLEVGRLAFTSLIKLDDKDASAYILMENIYGSLNMWVEQRKIESMRLDARAWKVPGQSWWTDLPGMVHSFLARDTSHPQNEKIRAKLEEILALMKEQGYKADQGLGHVRAR